MAKRYGWLVLSWLLPVLDGFTVLRGCYLTAAHTVTYVSFVCVSDVCECISSEYRYTLSCHMSMSVHSVCVAHSATEKAVT